MTIRKGTTAGVDAHPAVSRPRAWTFAALAGIVSLAVCGCSTPGPLHLYSIGPGAKEVHDTVVSGTDATQQTPDYLDPTDTLTGFAYDPFTDHFFLRLAPGTHIRVVDRPARKIKREMDIDLPAMAPGSDAAAHPAGPVADAGGDLAVSPRTGHIYLVDGTRPDLIETTRFAKFIRRVPLRGRTTAVAAVAFDMDRERLLVLAPDARTVEVYTTSGEPITQLTLAETVAPSLAYDAVNHEYFAPLADAPDHVGVFDETGRLVRRIALAAGDRFIDVGPHSFLRVF